MVEVGREKLSVETVRITATAFDHVSGAGSGPQQYEDALLHPPELFDPMTLQIAFKLPVHYIRSEQQSNLSEFRKLLSALSGGRLAISLLQTDFRRRIYHFNLISLVEEA